MKKRIFAIIFFTLTLVLLTLFVFFQKKIHSPISSVYIINTSSVENNQNSDNRLVKLKITNNQLLNLDNCYVTIYKYQLNFLEPVYSFSILKTDDNGEVSFYLDPGKYLAIISSEEDISNNNKDKYLLSYKFVIHNSFIVPNISFSQLPLSSATFEPNSEIKDQINSYKIEAVYQTDLGPTCSNSIAQNIFQTKQTSFYVSPGTYNFNLDILNFDALPNSSYSLAVKNVNIIKNQKYHFYLPEDLSQLKKIDININNSEYSWIKTSSISKNNNSQTESSYYQDTGDFESTVFNHQLSIFTDQANLTISMIYTPLKKCMTYYLSTLKITPSIALLYCKPTNIRYDFSVNSPLSPVNTLNPPNRIILFLYNNDQLSYFYQNNISHIYIHEIWDQEISPIIKITDKITNKVYQYNIQSLINKPLSKYLPNGSYHIEANMPATTWSPRMSGSLDITITNSQINSPLIPPKPDYFFTWQELYQNRHKIFGFNPYSYLSISIDKSNFLINPIVQNTQYITISNCQEINLLTNDSQPPTTIIVNINPNEVNNTDQQKKYLQCLVNYAKKAPTNVQFALKNSFIQSAFATQTTYVFYHFYQTIRGKSSIPIGIVVENFRDFFHGIADFNLVSTTSFQESASIPKNETKNILESWLLDYREILNNNPPPNIYY